MKNYRIFANRWFRVGSIALVLGVVLLVAVLNLPASAEPPERTLTVGSQQTDALD